MPTTCSAVAQYTKIQTDLPVICGIYSITHADTGFRYIGQSIDCVRRMLDHERYNNSLIGKAIRFYGREAFVFEVLETAPRKELLKREADWIETFNTIYPKGFNLIAGGHEVIGVTQREKWMRAKRNARVRAKAKKKADVFA